MAKSRRAKKQISKVNPKMGYFGGPNMPLSQNLDLRQIWSHFGDQTGKRRRGRGEEEEEEEGKFKQSSIKVWKLP